MNKIHDIVVLNLNNLIPDENLTNLSDYKY